MKILSKQTRPATSTKQAMQLFKYLKPHLAGFSAGMLFLLLSSLAGLAFPKLLGELIDASKKNHDNSSINMIGLLLIAMLAAQSVFSYFKTMLFVNVSEKTLATLRQTIYNHLIQLPMNFFLTRRVGELSSRISSDITLLQETF